MGYKKLGKGHSFADLAVSKSLDCSRSLKMMNKINKVKISKKRYIVEQYFGLSHLHDGAYRARFTTILKNMWDAMCRQIAFNMFRGSRLLVKA